MLPSVIEGGGVIFFFPNGVVFCPPRSLRLGNPFYFVWMAELPLMHKFYPPENLIPSVSVGGRDMEVSDEDINGTELRGRAGGAGVICGVR